MDLKKRVELLEKKMAALEDQVQEQPQKYGIAFLFAIKSMNPNLNLGEEVEKVIQSYFSNSFNKAL